MLPVGYSGPRCGRGSTNFTGACPLPANSLGGSPTPTVTSQCNVPYVMMSHRSAVIMFGMSYSNTLVSGQNLSPILSLSLPQNHSVATWHPRHDEVTSTLPWLHSGAPSLPLLVQQYHSCYCSSTQRKNLTYSTVLLFRNMHPPDA